jgi:transcriptional regulator with XRE-family HTH domain
MSGFTKSAQIPWRVAASAAYVGTLTQREAIKTCRLIHGLSQRKMAKVLKIDPTTLARWENVKSKPGALLKRRLAHFMGISDGSMSLIKHVPRIPFAYGSSTSE